MRGNMVWRGSSSQVPNRCTRCNSIYHAAERCFAINMVCHNCGGVGHLLRACNLPVGKQSKRFDNDGKPGGDLLEVATAGAKQEAMLDEGKTEKSVSEIVN